MKSLQKKLLLSYAGLIVTLFILVSVGVSLLIREYFLVSKQQELLNKGKEFVHIVEQYAIGQITSEQLSLYVNSVDRFLDARVWLMDASGKVIAISMPRPMEHHGGWMKGHMLGRGGQGHGMGQRHEMPSAAIIRSVLDEMAPVFEGRECSRTLEHPFYNEQMLIAAIPLRGSNGAAGAVLLNAPIASINDFMLRIYGYIAGVGMLAVLLALAASAWLSTGIVRPLKQMQRIAGEMAGGNYSTRVSVNSQDEVGELAGSLNSLAQELEKFAMQTQQAEKLRREFVANVSHELRTPLTIIKGYNEAMLDGAITDPAAVNKYRRLIREETERMERLISDLLDLSRLQAGNGIDMEIIPLGDLAEAVTAKFSGQANEKGIQLLAEAQPATVLGNGDRLTQLMMILLDNAIKYTQTGGTVKVSVEADRTGVVLEVSDTGCGIPPEDVPFIWERFYKVNKSHSRSEAGAGLGMAIAREIIELHKGKSVVESFVNKGTTIRISFPYS